MNLHSQKQKPLLTPKIWKRDEILTFLDIFELTFHASVSDPFDSESDMWKCISNKLLDQGFIASAQHCQNKWNFLYKTYANNQNRQGAFYAKIKQIVDFSQQMNDHPEQESVPDPEPETELVVKAAFATAVEVQPVHQIMTKQEVLIHEEAEEQPVDELVETLEECEATIADNLPEPEENQNQSLHEIPEESLSLASSKSLTFRNETDCSVAQKEEQVDDNHDNLSHVDKMDLKDVLFRIANKIDAIHKEQAEQGRRLKDMERLELENKQCLLDIKQHLHLN